MVRQLLALLTLFMLLKLLYTVNTEAHIPVYIFREG